MTESVNLPDGRSADGNDEISLLDLLLVLAESARLIVFGPLVAGLVALAYAFTITPIFTATTKILPPLQQQGSAGLVAAQMGSLASLAAATGIGGFKNPADTYVALIKSRTVADRIIDRFGLMQVYQRELRQDARTDLEGATKVGTGRDGLINIDVDDKDPKRAAEIANAYVEELDRLNSSLAVTEAQQRRAFFEKEIRKSGENLKNAQIALGEVGASESLIKSSPEAVVAAIAAIKARITAQEVKLATMRGYLTEQSPEFQLASRELASLRAQLAQTDQNRPVSGTQRAEYLNRYRDFKYFELLYELMVKQYEAARIDEAREGGLVQVVDAAQPPEWKSKPKKALIAVLTTFGAFLFIILFVFVRHALRSAAKDVESAEKMNRIVRLLLGKRA